MASCCRRGCLSSGCWPGVMNLESGSRAVSAVGLLVRLAGSGRRIGLAEIVYVTLRARRLSAKARTVGILVETVMVIAATAGPSMLAMNGRQYSHEI